MTVAIQIVNYNLKHQTDKIVEFLENRVSVPHFFTIVDNGSDPEYISEHTTFRSEKNLNKLGGVLKAFELSAKKNPQYIWTISTSMELIPEGLDPVKAMTDTLEIQDNYVGISPTFVGDLTDPPHRLMARWNGFQFHVASGSIGMFSLYRTDWILGDGYPDPRLTSSWGTDYEMKYKAKQHGKFLLLSDMVSVHITKAPAYKLGRTKKTLSAYEEECRREMETVLTEKYGKNWKKVLGVDHYA